MKICGLQKTTLLDFPGRVAATLFTGGCNFRCPFCHNSGLLSGDAEAAYSVREILQLLEKRKRILEGVCITGGEPTLQPDLEDFIRDIRSLGLAVKLDTNGYRPDVLKALCQKGLLDYAAMDIKAGRDRYETAAGICGLDMKRIDESIRFLLEGHLPYELRTTVVRGIHEAEDFRQIGPWIKGCHRYFLQAFKDSGDILVPQAYDAFSAEEMRAFMELVRPYAEEVSLRGIDYPS